MVVVELAQEVAADVPADGIFDEGQVILEVFLAKDDMQKIVECFTMSSLPYGVRFICPAHPVMMIKWSQSETETCYAKCTRSHSV